MEAEMATIEQEYKRIIQEFRLFNSGDAWGHCMHWWFTVADELYWREGYTPPHWRFKPSPLGPVNDPDDFAASVAKEIGAEALIKVGNCLFRYANLLKRHNKDY